MRVVVGKRMTYGRQDSSIMALSIRKEDLSKLALSERFECHKWL